jgi:rhomboid-like protein
MISLFGLGLPLARMIGSPNFLLLYFGSGILSALAFLGSNALLSQNQNRVYANGASGAVYGTMAFFACMQPRATFLLFFVLPVPAWILVPSIFAWDAYHIFNRGVRTVGMFRVG